MAKRAVRTTFIVLDTPAFQDDARLVQIAEEFAARFPRAPRLDVEHRRLLIIRAPPRTGKYRSGEEIGYEAQPDGSAVLAFGIGKMGRSHAGADVSGNPLRQA